MSTATFLYLKGACLDFAVAVNCIRVGGTPTTTLSVVPTSNSAKNTRLLYRKRKSGGQAACTLGCARHPSCQSVGRTWVLSATLRDQTQKQCDHPTFTCDQRMSIPLSMFTARAGPIPEELGALKELRELSLSSNQLTGAGRALRFGSSWFEDVV